MYPKVKFLHDTCLYHFMDKLINWKWLILEYLVADKQLPLYIYLDYYAFVSYRKILTCCCDAKSLKIELRWIIVWETVYLNGLQK